jgi:hypothetical protein
MRTTDVIAIAVGTAGFLSYMAAIGGLLIVLGAL